MKHLSILFVSTFVFIFLKAFQQRNVIHNDWRFIAPTSMGMAFVEYYVIALVAQHGYGVSLVLVGGAGAGLGAMSAMFLHNIHLKRKAQ